MGKIRKLISSFSRFVLVLFVLLSAFVFAMFQGGYVSWTIFYAVLPFILYSVALFFYPLSDITADRIIRTPNVQNGENLVVTISVRRNSRFPLLYTVIGDKWMEDEMQLHEHEKMNEFFIFGLHKNHEWNYEVERMPRGEHILKGISIELTDFFGWIRKTHFIPLENTILVYPKFTDIHYVPIDTQFERGEAVSPYNIVKDTTMVTGIREYQSGDRVSWIHWKSFARTQTLMTKEFEDRRSQALFLTLDGRPSEVFEEQVELAASILKEASTHQVDIGFLSTGAAVGTEYRTSTLIQSEEQFRRALIHLAKIKPVVEASTSVVSNYENGFVQGGSVIVVTARPDWFFLEPLVINATSARSIICFVVVKEDTPLSSKLEQEIGFAKSKGISVHVLAREGFLTAFNEVSQS